VTTHDELMLDKLDIRFLLFEPLNQKFAKKKIQM